MDRGYLVGATPPTVLYRLFQNFTGVLVMVWRYACSLCIILRLFFVTFSQFELSHFSGIFYNKVNGQGIPCGCNSSYSFLPIFLKLHWCFVFICILYLPYIAWSWHSLVILNLLFEFFLVWQAPRWEREWRG